MPQMGEEERSFLRARADRPGDPLVLLVYADWLDDHDQPAKAEFLRLGMRWAELPSDDLECDRVRERLAEVRTGLDDWWVALFEPPVWAIAGNVIGERPTGPGGTETQRGTRLFRPNAKVYLAETARSAFYLLNPDPGHRYGRVIVIGQQRQSRTWVQCWVRPDYVTNWRPELVYAPGPKVRLRRGEWTGFRLRPGDFTRPAAGDGLAGCRALLDAINARR